MAATVRAQDPLDSEVQRFVEVFSHVERNLAGPVDAGKALYQGAIPGMLQTLDPHSVFLDPDQFESLQEMQRSTEKGFGSVVSLVPGRVIVLQTLSGSPSARSGIAAGDEIVAINNYSLAQFGLDQLVALLGQSRRRKAELMVKRPGFPKLIPMTLVPEEMADPGVERSFFLKPGIAYVRVGNFEANTADELHKSIEDLGGKDLKGLLLDLRGNPGGLVESAVKTASFFLKPQQRILWIEGRDGPKEEVRVPEGFVPYDFPLALLINSRTASAAELVAGALQDNNRATVLGEASFGKALVQSVFELSEQTAVALTTARYLTPSGRQIQRSLGDCRLYQLNPCPKEGVAPEPKSTSNGELPPEGGVIPNEVVYPRGYTRFEAVMEGTNSFLDFAQPYVKRHPEIGEDFEPDPQMLDDFQLFLSERRIRPALSEWSAHLDYISNRLKQEVLNLTAGVARGDEIEAERDAQIQAALKVLTGS